MRIHMNSRGAQWETRSKKGATGWRPSRGSHPQLPLLSLPLASSLKILISSPGADVNVTAGRARRLIYFARAMRYLAEYLISPVILRATVQIRHEGVLPHPPEGHRHLSTVVESKNGTPPRCASRGYRASIEISTGEVLRAGHYLFAARYRDNDSPSSDGHRSLRGKRRSPYRAALRLAAIIVPDVPPHSFQFLIEIQQREITQRSSSSVTSLIRSFFNLSSSSSND